MKIITGIIAVLFCVAVSAKDMPDTQPASLPISVALEKYGAMCDVYFTVERDARNSEKSELDGLINDTSFKSADEFVRYLRKTLTRFDVDPDTFNPGIVHLIEKSLKTVPDYPLEKKISISLVGSPRALVEELSNSFDGRLTAPNTIWIGESFGDLSSQLRINAKNQPVRSVLSVYLPLENYFHVLWQSEARSADGRILISVRHSGVISEKANNAPPQQFDSQIAK